MPPFPHLPLGRRPSARYPWGLDPEWNRRKEKRSRMSKRGLGSLADLAKILEEAANPESALREDRKESKPKPQAPARLKARPVDPKRKAWYAKRLKEQSAPVAAPAPTAPAEPLISPTPVAARTAAVRLGGTLLQTLASAQDAKPKAEGKNRVEAWRRKPGDPLF